MLKIIALDKKSQIDRNNILKIYKELERLFKFKIPEVTIFIYDNRKDFNKYLNRETPEWLVANASDDNVISILSPLRHSKKKVVTIKVNFWRL